MTDLPESAHFSKKDQVNHLLDDARKCNRPPAYRRTARQGSLRLPSWQDGQNGKAGEERSWRTFSPSCLGTDANPILDHIEGFFGHDVFGDQFALDLVWAIADDPVRHVLWQP